MKATRSKSVGNFYLIGMMGAGKTETGKHLARFLGIAFVDLDRRIEESEKATIPELFDRRGEVYFREAEAAALDQVAALQPTVVATGGGIVLKPENRKRMRDSGEVIYLRASLESLWERTKGRGGRPLLEGPEPREKLKRIFLDRKALYEGAASRILDTDGKTPSAVAQEIMEQMKNR